MDVGLYLHFPFCVRKCRYCDFLSFPADEELKKIYAAAMIREIRGYAGTLEGRRVDSIYLGGGTPSVMNEGALKSIFRALGDSFDISPKAEITMEMNPGTVNTRILSFVFDCVNRVSLGVQSAVGEELSHLGRIHTAKDAEKSVRLLKDCGINNISIDLMSGIPLQTPESFRQSIQFAVDLEPSHISCYSLIVEEGTEYARLQKEGRLPLPDEETVSGMFHDAKTCLENAGYRRYEISNYAKDGMVCRHNVRYWKRGDYIGFGIGAASLFEHTRWRNTRKITDYIDNSHEPGRLVREMEQLDKKSEIEEFMFLELRMDEGVSAEEFRSAFGIPIGDVYGDVIDEEVRKGLLIYDGERVRLTGRGVDVSNMVLSEFLF